MKKRRVAILGGRDWNDASVDFIDVKEEVDLDKEHDKYRSWYKTIYCEKYKSVKYMNFVEWLIKNDLAKYNEDIEEWEEI